MRKLLLLPITLPLSMARGAVEGALRATADALMDLAAGGAAAEADVYVAQPSAPPPAPRGPRPAEPAARPSVEELVDELEDEDVGTQDDAPAAEVVDLPVTPATARDAAVELGLEQDHVEEEAPELVESEGAADPGAEITVDEPWPGYGALKAADVVDRLGAADPATKAIVRLYEQSHRKRRTVLAATE